MENTCGDKCECNGDKLSCCGGFSKCGCGKKHFIIKKILMLVILMITFCLGYQFGELKAMLRGNYNYRMTNNYDNNVEMRDIWNKMSNQDTTVLPSNTTNTLPVKK
jgi:hypothetical protein